MCAVRCGVCSVRVAQRTDWRMARSNAAARGLKIFSSLILGSARSLSRARATHQACGRARAPAAAKFNDCVFYGCVSGTTVPPPPDRGIT